MHYQLSWVCVKFGKEIYISRGGWMDWWVGGLVSELCGEDIFAKIEIKLWYVCL